MSFIKTEDVRGVFVTNCLKKQECAKARKLIKPSAKTAKELMDFKSDTNGYIKYLLKIGAYRHMADMARDLGVSDAQIRQIKYREAIKKPG